MTNSANQATVATFDEVLKKVQATKKLDSNGNPVYKLPFQTILDAGYTLTNLADATKSNGMRQNRKSETVSFQSYNLVDSLKNLFAALNRL